MKLKTLGVIALFFWLCSTVSFAWTLDKSNVDWDVELTESEQAKFDIFQNAIANDNLSPRDAANRAGGADFKRLSDGYYQIRLSKGARVRFEIDWDRQHVKILQVGGHT